MAWDPSSLYKPGAFDLPGPRNPVQPPTPWLQAQTQRYVEAQLNQGAQLPTLLVLMGLGLLAWKVLE